MSQADSPGVRIPPPLIFGALTGAGLLLEPGNPSAGLLFLAAVAGICGLALVAGSLDLFRRFRVRPEPWQPASKLIVRGFYRYSRNPMYLGMALLCAALALGLASTAAGAGVLIAVATMDRLIIPREEAYLHRTFGGDYRNYCAVSPRWFSFPTIGANSRIRGS